MRRSIVANIQDIGHRVIESVWRLGHASRFFILVLLKSGTCLRRFSLVMRELYYTGVLSLIIIIVSGLFVGMVLGLQGYETLQKYGSESAVGTLVALSLVRELGPGGRSVAICQPCRFSDYRRNWFDEGHRTISCNGYDGR